MRASLHFSLRGKVGEGDTLSPLCLGAHMSITGGLWRAIERVCAVGGSALQLFTANQRRWDVPYPSPDDIRRFRVAYEAWGGVAASHASYLINLATPDTTLADRSVAALGVELQRSEALGLPYVVVHPGAHCGGGVAAGIERVALRAAQAIDASQTRNVMLLLENTAGQGTTLGADVIELAQMLEQIPVHMSAHVSAQTQGRMPDLAPDHMPDQTSDHVPDQMVNKLPDQASHQMPDRTAGQQGTGHARSARVGVCIDTAHAFAAGYDIASGKGFTRFMDDLAEHVGLERLHFMHVNDSAVPCGSRKDRHAHIGEGGIGLGGFARVVNDPRLAGLPMVLETPKGDDLAEDRTNLAVLRGLWGKHPAAV